jgi:hypothetical protein
VLGRILHGNYGVENERGGAGADGGAYHEVGGEALGLEEEGNGEEEEELTVITMVSMSWRRCPWRSSRAATVPCGG